MIDTSGQLSVRIAVLLSFIGMSADPSAFRQTGAQPVVPGLATQHPALGGLPHDLDAGKVRRIGRVLGSHRPVEAARQ
jgi:hypothetical protein